jgi:hypothetical protein
VRDAPCRRAAPRAPRPQRAAPRCTPAPRGRRGASGPAGSEAHARISFVLLFVNIYVLAGPHSDLDVDVHVVLALLACELEGVLDEAGLCTDEGALSFVISTYCIYMDSPHELEWGSQNDRRPASKPARVHAAMAFSTEKCSWPERAGQSAPQLCDSARLSKVLSTVPRY